MQEIAKAVIIITCDDVNDYFLVIDLATGKEVKRVSTEQLGIWRWNDGYSEEDTAFKVAESCGVKEFNIIRWY